MDNREHIGEVRWYGPTAWPLYRVPEEAIEPVSVKYFKSAPEPEYVDPYGGDWWSKSNPGYTFGFSAPRRTHGK